MRLIRSLIVLIALCGASAAAGQTVALHQAGTPVSAAPAKASAAAIIPGSPLAALTEAASPAPDADASTPAPFGTDTIGLSIASAVTGEASHTLRAFLGALRRSTALTPVLDWLRSFATDPWRRADFAAIAEAVGVILAPGLVVEFAIHAGLARPRLGLAARARRQLGPDPASEDADDDGLASAEAGETEPHLRRRDIFLVWIRKCVFALLYFGLSLLPLAGFILTVQMLVSAGMAPTRPARLAVDGLVNAYLFCRLVIETAKLAMAPTAPSLRLMRFDDAQARTVIHWLRLLLGTGFAAYALISVAEILGLAHAGALVIIRLAALVIHVEVATAIWASRRTVGSWIAGPPEAEGAAAGFRRWLGRTWHIPALFYVLALWIGLAAGVHDAFTVLLRVVLVVGFAGLIGRLAWSGSSALLERAFPDPDSVTARHPALYARARAYNPLIRGLIRATIGVLVAILTLQGWGVNAIGWLLTDPFSRSLIGAIISIIITIAAALILWELANAYMGARIERLVATGRAGRASRLRTLLPMLKAAIGVTLFLLAFFICLEKIGVNTAPLLAISGVAGIAIGFGSQKLVQDIITGLFLLLEDAMQVGDVITLAGMTGTVERLSIRTIRLRGADGSVNIIPFSAVTTVTNMTRDFSYAEISIQVGYEEDLNRVYAVLHEILADMRADPEWSAKIRGDLKIFGLDQFGASALVITGQIRTGPGLHWAVRREFYARVKQRFEAEHIEMPYTYLPPAPKQPSAVSGQLSESKPPEPDTDD